jgi:hypothetical protein
MLIKTLIVLVLIVILASLAVALNALLRDGERSPRTVKALTFRIGVSLALFFLLLIGYQAGILHPHGLNTGIQAQAAKK